MFDVVAFSEAIIRWSPPNDRRLEQTPSLGVQMGGGELNAAVGGKVVSLKGLREGKLDAFTPSARQFLEAVRSGRAAAAGKSP